MASENTPITNIYIHVLEGAMKGKALSAQYNPQEISFQKSVGWEDSGKGAGTDCPSLMFTAGQAITMSLELLFDQYEAGLDIRPIVKAFVSLCMIDSILKRPPLVQLCGRDSNLLGIGNFIGVIESATAKYTMFTSDGIPCRATVSINIKQADPSGSSGSSSDSQSEGDSGKVAVKASFSAAELSNTPNGLQNAVNDGKDPSKPENYPL